MRTVLNIVGFIIMMALMAYLLQDVSEYDLKNELVRECNEVNKTLPEAVTPNITLERTSPGPGKRITCTFTVIDESKNDLAPEKLEKFKEAVQKDLLQNDACADLIDKGVVFVLLFRSTCGRELATVQFP